MKSLLDSKAMAKALRQSLAERNIKLSHGECLELVAKQFGVPGWNVLAAQIEVAKAKLTPLPMAPGWFSTEFTDTQRYRIGLDNDNTGNALIECTVGREVSPRNERFACMMQSIDAHNYRGMKLRLTAKLRCEDADLGTIWMRVDGTEQRSLRFDNMMQRQENGPLKGTVGWTSRSVVLDIPSEAASLHYGFFLKGHGKVWARNFRLVTVSDTIPVTQIEGPLGGPRLLPSQPINLDFASDADLLLP